MDIVDDIQDQFSADAMLARLAYAQGRVNLHWVYECESSNSLLLEMAKAGAPAGTVLLAHNQTAGRGRRGRLWHQSEQGLAFSLLWRLPAAADASGLSLAAGLGVAESLGDQAQLKWPNDVLLHGRKIAGILIESPAPGLYVIGIGVNLGALGDLPELVAEAATSLPDANREQVMADILNCLIEVLDIFGEHGFAALQARWMARHAFQNLNVAVAEQQLNGLCRGVDADGALLVETAQGVQRVISGDVSVRLQ